MKVTNPSMDSKDSDAINESESKKSKIVYLVHGWHSISTGVSASSSQSLRELSSVALKCVCRF